MLNIIKSVITNVLKIAYQSFWFSIILSVFVMFFYMYAYEPKNTGKGMKAAIYQWYLNFKESTFFRKCFLLVFSTVMILFCTLLNRNIWANPLSNVMGGWWIWKTASDGKVTLTTEYIKNGRKSCVHIFDND